MPTDKFLDTLVINEVDTPDTFVAMVEKNLVNAQELYLVDDNAHSSVVDAIPTEESFNLVSSGGVYQAIKTHNEDENAHPYIQQAITEATGALKDELLNGAGEAYDTLKELGDLITENDTALEALEQVATGKQDKLTGQEGQFVGFDANGNPVAQSISTAAPFVISATAPAETGSFWIDTSANNLLKFYNPTTSTWEGISSTWG